MDIYLANFQLRELNSKSINQTLISKLGNKTIYCQEFIKILNSANIPINYDKLVETKWRILHLDFSKKYCKRCGSDVNFVSLYKGFQTYCSGSCGALHRDNSTRKGWLTESGKQIRKSTIFEKYGVEHQLHVPEIFERQQNNRYKTYSIFSPSGKEFKVQGYERFIIPALWRQYQEDDIVVQKKALPKINYNHEGKIKKYYPDCSIKSENIIVEVKSTYTIKSETLIPKLEATATLGYIPKVYLYDKGIITVLSLDDVKKYLTTV
jgi:hypothetical protein